MGNTEQVVMEDISVAYVSAVAAANGYSVNPVSRDNDGVDIQVICKGKPAKNSLRTSPQLNIQLKSSYSKHKIKIDASGNVLYALEVKNYKSLIDQLRCTPLILVVLHMPPPDKSDWVIHTKDYLQLQKCAYWISLTGKEETSNKDSITIKIPPENIFSPSALRDIFIKIGEGKEDQL